MQELLLLQLQKKMKLNSELNVEFEKFFWHQIHTITMEHWEESVYLQ